MKSKRAGVSSSPLSTRSSPRATVDGRPRATLSSIRSPSPALTTGGRRTFTRTLARTIRPVVGRGPDAGLGVGAPEPATPSAPGLLRTPEGASRAVTVPLSSRIATSSRTRRPSIASRLIAHTRRNGPTATDSTGHACGYGAYLRPDGAGRRARPLAESRPDGGAPAGRCDRPPAAAHPQRHPGPGGDGGGRHPRAHPAARPSRARGRGGRRGRLSAGARADESRGNGHG